MSSVEAPYALISVFDKTGLVPFASSLKELGYNLLATGGSAKKIEEAGIDVLEVSDFTKEPELFSGRLKTLSPKIFGGILFNRDKEEDQSQSLEHSMPPIDLVVVNFYPFKEEAVNKNLSLDKAIEFVDIGGPSLLRAGAKNWKHTVSLSSPSDYSLYVDAIKKNELTGTLRKTFAAKAFKTVTKYDELISTYFSNCIDEPTEEKMPLRYGENPNQEAFLLKETSPKSLDKSFTLLHGKELSYNNILDLDSGVQIVKDFRDKPVCAILKHTNPCGLAWGDQGLDQIFSEALSTDPVSAFGGIVLTNCEIDAKTALLMNETFFEAILAPKFSLEALDILKSKKNRRLLNIDFDKVSFGNQVKSTVFGALHQGAYPELVCPRSWEHKAGPALSKEDLGDLCYSLCSVKHLKSNAISFVKGGKALGLASGHVSRVDACSHAITKAKSFGHDLIGSFMASDAFFPFKDCVELAIKEGVKGICEPGGSIRDEESIEACEKHGISLYFCHQRYFKH